MTPAERIFSIRKQTGLIQKDFAKKIGVSRATVINWEKGETEPSQTEIEGIVKKFNFESMSKPDNGKSDPSMDEVIQSLFDGNTAYVLMNKELILEKYRLVAIDQLTKQENDAQRKHEELLQELQNAKEEAQRKHDQYEKEIIAHQETITAILNSLNEIAKKIPNPPPLPPSIQPVELNKT